jgi:hypothetical protein
MILVDANLLLYAKFSDLPQHPRVRAWLEGKLNSPGRVGIPGVLPRVSSVVDKPPPFRASALCVGCLETGPGMVGSLPRLGSPSGRRSLGDTRQADHDDSGHRQPDSRRSLRGAGYRPWVAALQRGRRFRPLPRFAMGEPARRLNGARGPDPRSGDPNVTGQPKRIRQPTKAQPVPNSAQFRALRFPPPISSAPIGAHWGPLGTVGPIGDRYRRPPKEVLGPKQGGLCLLQPNERYFVGGRLRKVAHFRFFVGFQVMFRRETDLDVDRGAAPLEHRLDHTESTRPGT